jgi:hypothetical protein
VNGVISAVPSPVNESLIVAYPLIMSRIVNQP